MKIIDEGARILGKEHMWIETERFSLGMSGGRNRLGDSRGQMFSTEVVSHASEWKRTDVEIRKIPAHLWLDPSHPPVCGNRLESLFEDLEGTTLGTYVPYLNDCETFVRTMLRLAAVSADPGREIAQGERR